VEPRCDHATLSSGVSTQSVKDNKLETVARCYLTPYIDVGMDVHRLDEHFSISGQVALFDARGILPSLYRNYC